MKTLNVQNENWMVDILEHFEESISEAVKGFYKEYQYNDCGNPIPPGFQCYESPELEPVRLIFGDFSISDENEVLENRFELMEYIQDLVKSECTAPDLELIASFEYREIQGYDIKRKPIKSIIISAKWKEKNNDNSKKR